MIVNYIFYDCYFIIDQCYLNVLVISFTKMFVYTYDLLRVLLKSSSSYWKINFNINVTIKSNLSYIVEVNLIKSKM